MGVSAWVRRQLLRFFISLSTLLGDPSRIYFVPRRVASCTRNFFCKEKGKNGKKKKDNFLFLLFLVLIGELVLTFATLSSKIDLFSVSKASIRFRKVQWFYLELLREFKLKNIIFQEKHLRGIRVKRTSKRKF